MRQPKRSIAEIDRSRFIGQTQFARHRQLMLRVGETAGEKSRMAKLTESQVLEIRAAFDRGEKASEACVRFGVSKDYFRRVGLRRAWRHL